MAIPSEHMAELLVELGESSPRIETIIQDAEIARWAIALEDDLVVTAELDARCAVLCLAADLGQPSDRHRLAVCEALMTYASLQHSTDVGMALTEPGGEFQQLCTISTQDMDAERLQTVVLNFADRAQLWREVVANGADIKRVSGAAAEMLGLATRV